MLGFQVTIPSAHVLVYAIFVALDRESPTVEAMDLLAGLHIACSRRLSKYWTKARGFDRLLMHEPGVAQAIAAYHKGEFPSPSGLEQLELRGHFLPYSPGVARILGTACQLGASRALPALGGNPVLAPEDFLLAIARHNELEVGKRLVASGLDLRRLEKTVKTLRPQAG